MRHIVTSKMSPVSGGRVGEQNRQLRVLFINDTSRNGGPGRTILDILKFLNPDRIQRSVLIPRDDVVSRRLVAAGATEAIYFERGLIENIFEPITRPMEREDFNAPLPLRLVRAACNVVRGALGLVRLLLRVRRERFDLVFCNGTSANFVGGMLAVMTGIPVLWHVFYPCVPTTLRRLHLWFAAHRNVRSIVCVSRSTSLQFAALDGKEKVIHDALDIDEFDQAAALPALRREFGLDETTVVFGSHGRILPRKGYVELIQAARLVGERLTPAQRASCRFIVLGDTPQDIRPDHLEECRQLVRELGLEDLVQFIGDAVKQGKKVWVYGASTKGNTLLQYCGLDQRLISAAAERNSSKWGRVTVGTRIPIVSEEDARRARPDYMLVLPWHFLDEFMQREKGYLAAGGRFIIPSPHFSLI